jgi:Flp pilus assembly protein TadG
MNMPIDPTNRRRRTRGTALIYVTITIGVVFGFLSLAVDLGRIQVAKAELQAATDAAARYASAGMRSTMANTSGASANASASIAENFVDGTSLSSGAIQLVELGAWDSATRTFVVTGDPTTANAVRLTTSLNMGSGQHVLTLLSLFGKTVTVHASSIAMINGQDATTVVSAKGNPWLAGMPAGTVSTDFRTNASEQDTAGTGPNDLSSPAMIALSSLGVSSGSSITFDGVTGSTDFGGGTTGNADGDSTKMCTLGSPVFGNNSYLNSPTNGMSNCYAPVNALMAVFLDGSTPSNSGPSITPLDFSTAASRDYTSLSPQLKQVFFVGDGRRANGEIQQIVVPTGATRVFFANMDGWQYNNNTGGFSLSVHATNQISIVK